MSVTKYLESLPLHTVDLSTKNKDYRKECIPFIGSPRKHPYDSEKILLISEPFSSHTIFYEFLFKDILNIDDEPSIATENGENLTMVRVWVRKGSLGLQYQPFEVADPLKYLKDSEVLKQNVLD